MPPPPMAAAADSSAPHATDTRLTAASTMAARAPRACLLITNGTPTWPGRRAIVGAGRNVGYGSESTLELILGGKRTETIPASTNKRWEQAPTPIFPPTPSLVR